MLVNVDENQTVYVKYYTCSVCGVEEMITSLKPFTPGRIRKSGMCKKCRNKSYYTADPTKHQNLLLQRRYGISLNDYKTLYTQQKGNCAICGKHSSEFSKNLCVDHNHITGQVRALLCIDCNRNVGVYENFKTQIELYLDKYEKGGLSACER